MKNWLVKHQVAMERKKQRMRALGATDEVIDALISKARHRASISVFCFSDWVDALFKDWEEAQQK